MGQKKQKRLYEKEMKWVKIISVYMIMQLVFGYVMKGWIGTGDWQ